MTIDLEAIKARLAAPHAAGAYDITVRLANGRLCLSVRMRDWDGNTAQDAYAAVAHLLGHAPADLTTLVAEVERLRASLHATRRVRDTLRGRLTRLSAILLRADDLATEAERAAVVKWLRSQAYLTLYEATPDAVADAIERGEHRREGDE